MSPKQAEKLARVVHGHWPKISIMRKGEPNPDVYPTWVKYFQQLDHALACEVIGDYFSGATKIPGGHKLPAFRDISFEVRARQKQREQVESFHDAQRPRPIRLNDFEDGDYVFLEKPFRPANMLPGGRITKAEYADCITEVPLHITNSMGLPDGYHLMSLDVTNPASLQHIHLMNEEQRENWIRDMDALERDGKLSKFSTRRGD